MKNLMPAGFYDFFQLLFGQFELFCVFKIFAGSVHIKHKPVQSQSRVVVGTLQKCLHNHAGRLGKGSDRRMMMNLDMFLPIFVFLHIFLLSVDDATDIRAKRSKTIKIFIYALSLPESGINFYSVSQNGNREKTDVNTANGNIIRYQDGNKIIKHIRRPLINTVLIANDLKKHTLQIPPESYNSRLELHFSEIKKLKIGENSGLTVDLRDNPYIGELIVEDGFSGSINLARSSIRKITIGANCRCDLTLEDCLNCFVFKAGDVFSGRLKIKNSCFHSLSVGYYCYADIKMENIRGRKRLSVGASFRGTISVTGLSIPLFKIGHDCRGRIVLSGQSDKEHTGRLNILDDFAGTLDLSSEGQAEKIEVGSFASGNFNLPGCRGLKFLKFEDAFSGIADLSGSDIEYIRAGNGCRGKIVVLNCPRLTLLELPLNKQSDITAERNPLRIEIRRNSLHYHFHEHTLPRGYFTPFYTLLFRKLRRRLRRI